MTREQMWSAQVDAAREPSDRRKVIAVIGMLALGAAGWAWTVLGGHARMDWSAVTEKLPLAFAGLLLLVALASLIWVVASLPMPLMAQLLLGLAGLSLLVALVWLAASIL